MRFREIPTEKYEPFNEVINYIHGKAIVKDEYDNIFVCEIPEEFVNMNEPMLLEDLTPISQLPEDEQKQIMREISK